MIVIKRDGRKVEFDKYKIKHAMELAFVDIDKELSSESINKINEIATAIEEELNRKYQKNGAEFEVEEIQDIIEKKLMASNRKDVAKNFILYRNERTIERSKRSKLNKSITKRLKAINVENQNANVDEHSFGGKVGAISSDVLKEYALNNCMCRKSKNNHLNNEIYIHDLDAYAIGDHNCLSIPFDDLLANGFNTRQTDVRPANSINTAFQLVAVIFQLQSLQQFGGVSATHLDWTMVPYVRKSFYKHYKNGCKYINPEENRYIEEGFINNTTPINEYPDEDSSVYKYAMDMTVKETTQAVEGMYHNLKY